MYLFFLITRIMKILKRRLTKSVGKMGNTQEIVDLAERMPVSWSTEPFPNLVSYKKLRRHLIGIVLWFSTYLLTDRWLEHCNVGFKHILSTCISWEQQHLFTWVTPFHSFPFWIYFPSIHGTLHVIKVFFCNCFCFLQWLLKLFMNNFLVWLFLFFRTLLPILLKAEQMTQGDGALPVLIQLQRTGSRLKSYIKVK